MPTDTQKILTGASGLFSSILGIATGNPVALGGGLATLQSILSPTQRTTIQSGTQIANNANSEYQSALNSLTIQANTGATVPRWLLFVLGGGLLLLIFKPFKRRRH